MSIKFKRCYILVPILTLLSLQAHADTFVVNNTNDSGNGSLRRAINNANATPGTDNIIFNIPGPGPYSIEPLSQLPTINEALRISGFTQSGAVPANLFFVANLRVKIDGSSAGFSSGLDIATDNVKIWGLVIKNFEHNGITINGSNNLVRGSYIGVARRGLSERPNGSDGIHITGDANQIGGHLPQHRNLISSNVFNGINVEGHNNLIRGNYIGTDINTIEDFGNGEAGIRIRGDNNLIGGTLPNAGNVISGNSTGVDIRLGQHNQVQGNIIGTDNSATQSLFIGNATGVRVNGLAGQAGENEIGGETPEARNTISNNIGVGIELLNDGNRVQGNYIGTDGSGSFALENSAGISIRGDDNLVGGLSKSSRNIISGNNGYGIAIQGLPSVAGHDLFGNKPSGNKIQANFIGTDVTGEVAVANGAGGIYVKDADATAIGGRNRTQGNLISGNGSHGVKLEKVYDEFGGTLNTFVFNNTIGTDVNREDILENTGSGIFIQGASLTRIGGVHRGRENYIAGNAGNGITIESGVDNGIVRNWFHSNAGLSIDLDDNGVSDNDLLDTDFGGNRLQNFMQINTVLPSGSSVAITATLQSTQSALYRVDFYATANCDSTGHGEGEIFLGARQVTTGFSGLSNFSLTSSVPVPIGHAITGTVSVLGGPFPGDTSEFSECVVL